MKKYVIKDEDGKVVEVSEYEEGEKPVEGEQPVAPEKPEEGAHDEAFSPEQIEAIKSIVAEAIAEALKAKEEPAPEAHDEEEHQPENPEEEGKVGDSVAASAGSIENRPNGSTNDSALPSEEEINKIWADRFKD